MSNFANIGFLYFCFSISLAVISRVLTLFILIVPDCLFGCRENVVEVRKVKIWRLVICESSSVNFHAIDRLAPRKEKRSENVSIGFGN
jgi:hypothetical protein